MYTEDYTAEGLSATVHTEVNDWLDEQQASNDDEFIERYYESLNFSIEDSIEYDYMIGQYLIK